MKRLLRRLLSGAGPDPATPLRQMVFVSVDCEMTGLNPARDDLLAVGAVALRGMRMDLSATFRGLLRPARPVRPEGVPVHRILPGEAARGDEAASELARFDAWLAGLAALPSGVKGTGPSVVLLGWCLGLDEAFLAAGRRRAGLPARAHPRCDVLDLFRHLRASGRAAPTGAPSPPLVGAPFAPAPSCTPAAPCTPDVQAALADIPLKDADLYAVARALDVNVHDAHDALGDACLCAQVFQRLVPLLERRLGRRAAWGDLARAEDAAACGARHGGGAFGL
ncbi:exonuclease domain-containing protein [Nitratidesulfovibrio sp. 1201_IL3209]|uniref:exonuclease domain-containing protein n=1 Tax=Nitratidesulfovibrio sp. 1201_IL3209 TaxID=3084053 RepID=UPI002FD8AD35